MGDRKYFVEAADKGYAAGYCCLGLCFLNGSYGECDEVEAAKYFALCREKGYGYTSSGGRDGAYQLASMHYNGRGGLPVDWAKAKECALEGVNMYYSFACKQLYDQIVEKEEGKAKAAAEAEVRIFARL